MKEQEENGVPALDLVEVLGDFMVSQEKDREKKGRIYASELGIALGPDFDGCTLGFYLKCKDEPRRKRGPGEILMTQVGHLLHDYLGDIIAKAIRPHGWVVIGLEQRVHIEHGDESIGSRLDIEIFHLATGHRRVIDIKTKRGNAFGYLNEAKPGNVLQVQGYIKGTDANDGGLLYVDREGQNFMRYFEVERADIRPETAIEVLAAIRDNDTPPDPVRLNVVVKNNKGPDSVYLKVPWQIDWCDLKVCACKKFLPKGDVPSGIIAKLHPVKKQEGIFEVRYTDVGTKWADTLVPLLKVKYPDRTFINVHPEPKE